jgi:hypothetical protein
MSEDAMQGIKHISVDAVVIRKDGTREDLGTVAEWDESDQPKVGLIQLLKNFKNRD